MNAGAGGGGQGVGLPDICPSLTADSHLKPSSSACCHSPPTSHTRETARTLNLAGGGEREVSVSRVRAEGGGGMKETVDTRGQREKRRVSEGRDSESESWL